MRPREFISRFCASVINPLYAIPARHDGMLYASDGRILIATKDDPEVNALEDGVLTWRAIDLLGKMAGRDNWQPFDAHLPEAVPCPICGGVRRTAICKHCHGEGVLDNGDEYDACGNTVPPEKCPKCNGRPEWPDLDGEPCCHCDGTGEGFLAVPVGDTLLQRRYLALLQSLGDLSLSLGPAPYRCRVFPLRRRSRRGDAMPVPIAMTTVLLSWLALSLPVSLLIGAAIRAGSGEGAPSFHPHHNKDHHENLPR